MFVYSTEIFLNVGINFSIKVLMGIFPKGGSDALITGHCEHCTQGPSIRGAPNCLEWFDVFLKGFMKLDQNSTSDKYNSSLTRQSLSHYFVSSEQSHDYTSNI